MISFIIWHKIFESPSWRRRMASKLKHESKGYIPDRKIVSSKKQIIDILSDYEEYIWLSEQQKYDTVHAHVLTYRIENKEACLNCAKLAESYARLPHFIPALDVRYTFDADACLQKKLGSGTFFNIEILCIDSVPDALQLIEKRQLDKWDLTQEPPIRSMLLLGKAKTLLTLIVHRIVDEYCPIEYILRSLATLYNGDEPPVYVQTKSILDKSAVALLEWGKRKQFHILKPSIENLNISTKNLERTWKSHVKASSLVESVDVSNSKDVLEFLGILWASFLCKISGHREILLSLSSHLHARIGEPGWNYNTSDVLFHLIGAEQQISDLRNILRDTNISGQYVSNSTLLPVAHVKWLAQPEIHFPLNNVKIERFSSPILEPLPDFELAVSVDAQQVVLELTVGQDISPYVGGFLLELFSNFITTGHIPAPFHAMVTRASEVSDGILAVPLARDPELSRIQEIILTEFRGALASPEIKFDDDFFDRGGHSLIATRIIGRLLNNHGIEVHFSDIFSNPTAASLARKATLVKQTVTPPYSQANQPETNISAPLSLAQQSLWKVYSACDFNNIFNIPFALDFFDPVDEEVFKNAFTDIIKRHSCLRTLFHQKNGMVFQHIVSVGDLPKYKWFWGSEESTAINRHTEAGHVFDLSNELPIRLRFLINPVTKRQNLSLLFHHIVIDEWSVNLMMDELAHAYFAYAIGDKPVWDDLPAPFYQFAQLQNDRDIDRSHLDHWVNMLRDAPPNIPIFRSETQTLVGVDETSSAGGWIEINLEASVCDGLYQLAKQNNASLFNVSYAAIVAALYSISRKKDIVIGTSASGRTNPFFFDTIGYFTTVVAHRILFEETITIAELITKVRDTINNSMLHTEIPIDLIEEALGMKTGKDHLFEVFIQIHAKNKLNGTLQSLGDREIRFRQIDPDKHESLLGLQFEIMEEIINEQREVRIMMSYRIDHYSPEQVEKLRVRITQTLNFLAHPKAGEYPLTEIC